MTATAPRLLRRWTVGNHYTCEMHGSPASATQPAAVAIRWAPDRPASLSAAERREFRRHRDEAIEHAARALGIRPAVVAQLLDADPQPMADRASVPADERGSWNA